MQKLSEYFELTKPRLALMNVAVAAATFIFASASPIDWPKLGGMVFGLFLVIGSACTFNNVADRELDARMPRTKERAVAAGRIKPRDAYLFASILLLCGLAVLFAIRWLAFCAALCGWAVYVLAYTPLKKKSGIALFVGAFAGATPSVIGYAAAPGALDLYAFALFAFLFLWQIPHFLAIARYRYDDYTEGGVPLLVKRPSDEQARRRARKIFFYSLVVLVAFCVVLVIAHR